MIKKCTGLLLTIASLMANAQKTSLGIMAGLTVAKYKSDAMTRPSSEHPPTTANAGFMIGLVSSFYAGKQMRIQPELNYIQKGGKKNNESLILNYLEIPVNFVYKSNSTHGKFFAGCGPSFGFGLFGKTKTESSAYSGNINFGKDGDDYLHPFEIGANFTAGYELKRRFLFSASYNLSLNNIANEQPPNPGGGRLLTFYNRYFGFRIGYMFPSKKK